MSGLSFDSTTIHDIVGVGFGPSNLALAIAIAEHAAAAEGPAAAGADRIGPGPDDQPISAVFLERQAAFGWHRGMLLEDATMQVSFMKDLVTLRNPASRYSFLCYLHSKDRLIDFINHKSLFPLRVEFHDYLEWAARQVDHLALYQQEVIDVVPVFVDGVASHFNVIAQGPQTVAVFRARNVVFATGLRPLLPDSVKPSSAIWHSHDLLRRVAERADGPAPQRFVVVGAGQSAAEAAAFLHDRFPQAEVNAVFSRYGYSPADDSPFANRIFDPAAVDDFFDAPAETKDLLLRYHRSTNYSVVDLDLINDLYGRVYQEKVLGRDRLRIHNASRMTAADDRSDGVRVHIKSLINGTSSAIDADVLVCATGYHPADPSDILGDLGVGCHRDEQGRLLVGRDYRVRTTAELQGGIYLQGGTEHSHGITSSLLSATAVRSGEILQSVLDHRAGHRPARAVPPRTVSPTTGTPDRVSPELAQLRVPATLAAQPQYSRA